MHLRPDKVSGVVKSSTGEVLPGADDYCQRYSTGALAGPDGKFTITVPNAESVLGFLIYRNGEIRK